MKRTVWIIILATCVQIAGAQDINNERQILKDFAFARCLEVWNPDSDFWRDEGSAGALFEIGSFSIEAVEEIDKLAKSYLKKEFKSKKKQQLVVKRCLSFYRSPELGELASKHIPMRSRVETLPPVEEIPKGTNLIIFTSHSLKGEHLFDEIMAVLKKDKFDIEMMGSEDFDQQYRYELITAPKKRKGESLEFKFNIEVRENKAMIRSYIYDRFEYTEWERASYRKMKQNIFRFGWDRQVEMARAIRSRIPGDLEYETEER